MFGVQKPNLRLITFPAPTVQGALGERMSRDQHIKSHSFIERLLHFHSLIPYCVQAKWTELTNFGTLISHGLLARISKIASSKT